MISGFFVLVHRVDLRFGSVFLLSSCLDLAVGSFGRCVDRVR